MGRSEGCKPYQVHTANLNPQIESMLREILGVFFSFIILNVLG